MININNLYRSFGTQPVLQDLTLRIETNSITGVVGSNGAGKTTLFRCIAGLLPYDGTIEPSPSDLRNITGYLPTNPVFPSYTTGWEYLKLVCTARGIASEDFEEQNIFDLPLKSYADLYSTGMKKKLALYGLALQQNQFYLLDEPFNGVDMESNLLIVELLHLLRKQGKTILLSSHIFPTLRICDVIHRLDCGTIERTAYPYDFEALEATLRMASVPAARLSKLNLTD